jgi:hypothetical protein
MVTALDAHSRVAGATTRVSMDGTNASLSAPRRIGIMSVQGSYFFMRKIDVTRRL